MANKKDEDFQKGQSFDSIFTPADPAIFVCRGGSHEKGVAMGMWSLSSSGPPFTLLCITVTIAASFVSSFQVRPCY